MVTNWPLKVRIVVSLSLISFTLPIKSFTLITSPTLNGLRKEMKIPEIKLEAIFWKAKAKARPTTPELASLVLIEVSRCGIFKVMKATPNSKNIDKVHGQAS